MDRGGRHGQHEPRLLGFDGIGIARGTYGATQSPAFGFSFSSAGLTCAGADNPCHWRARLESRSPFFPRSPWFSPSGNSPTEADVRTSAPVVGIDPEAPAPSTLAFAAPYPNPTHGRTSLSFALPRTGEIRLVVRDLQGRTTRMLAAGWWPAGRHAIARDGRSESGDAAAPGVYFISLESQGERTNQRITLVR
ncbi:MAG: hypothetical protein HOP12_10930 [Candidatus Eisenbacteria bacterium]|uniref:T9SS type A sorting domain-containing protein n=1 Tax=Eiseniibacteriota bacterium TaxID=2212470 RepID=A0A849SP64_UNCEI|nr:hypothetical protein [Candidatus Eisenbacteria bacterium]